MKTEAEFVELLEQKQWKQALLAAMDEVEETEGQGFYRVIRVFKSELKGGS